MNRIREDCRGETSERKIKIAGKNWVVRTEFHNEGKGYVTHSVGVLENVGGKEIFRERNDLIAQAIGIIYNKKGWRSWEPSLPSQARK